MSVKIVRDSSKQRCTESDYVRVHTCSSPLDDTVTLATIQRCVERQRPVDAEGSKVHIKTLVMSQPMSRDEALGLATCYAERKQIPIVYTDMIGE